MLREELKLDKGWQQKAAGETTWLQTAIATINL